MTDKEKEIELIRQARACTPDTDPWEAASIDALLFEIDKLIWQDHKYLVSENTRLRKALEEHNEGVLENFKVLSDENIRLREALEGLKKEAEQFLVLFDVHGRTGKTPDGYEVGKAREALSEK